MKNWVALGIIIVILGILSILPDIINEYKQRKYENQKRETK